MDPVEAVTGEGAHGALQVEAQMQPLRRSVRVKASPDRAFRVFAEQMDTWWPKSHHIGSSPMKGIVVEGRPGGAIYTVQEDGTNCPWASVIAWEPPHRFTFAWHVTPYWKYEPDFARCSEVEVLFTPADDGTTLVELEHRHFERHGEGWELMQGAVGSEGGWNGVLANFVVKVEESA
ncbi:MAG: SRPBCC family protein [Terracidiphilus sp.]